MDNYYTRHTLGVSLKDITDGEARIIGTVKFCNVDNTNRKFLSKAIHSMAEKQCGEWLLVRAYDKVSNYEALKTAHKKKQKKLAKESRVAFVPPTSDVTDKSGYIVWMDSKVVLFYTNDLAATPTRAIINVTDEQAVMCINGLAEIHRWAGTETMSRTKFNVPPIIVAYNTFMNSVDRMDQLQATNATQRKESRVEMTLFTLFLDLAINNSFALMKKLWPHDASKLTIRDFKRSVCE